jgi:hypothetical protein
MWRASQAAVAILAWSAAALGGQYAPRVISPHNADAYSMKTFAQYPRWKDLTGDAKVYEVYKYLADTRTGIFPMGEGAREGKDAMYEFAYIRDPVKMINVYTCGYCDMLGPTMEGVMRDMGIGPARTVNLPQISHVVCEVYYNDNWHYLDLDLRGVFRRQDGTLASLADARQDESLWKGPRGPLFFPLDDLDHLRRDYQKARPEVRHGVCMGGATMDYVLRQGETFTRWWKPQGDRWNHHDGYTTGAMLGILNREPKGPKCKHTSYTIHASGNGCFLYKPDLTDRSTDLADGLYDGKDAASASGGLEIGPSGYAVFEVRSPYVIVPKVGKYETTDDDVDASVVRLDAQNVVAAVSQDYGMNWAGVEVKDGAVDLTPQVARTYGYLLRLAPAQTGQKALVKSIEITTWVQLHPASLPSLRKGANAMRYVTGDHYGLDTRVMEIRTNGSDEQDFLKWCSEPPKDFKPDRKTARAVGKFVVKVPAMPHTKVAWFSGGGNFNALQGDAAPRTANAMAWAAEQPADFKRFYQAAVPAGQSHWHYNADVEVRLDQPAKVLYLEYTGNPGVNNLRIYAHCLPDAPPSPQAVTITHKWAEKGQAKAKAVTLDKAGPYEIVCDEDPTDVSIEMTVPSRPK